MQNTDPTGTRPPDLEGRDRYDDNPDGQPVDPVLDPDLDRMDTENVDPDLDRTSMEIPASRADTDEERSDRDTVADARYADPDAAAADAAVGADDDMVAARGDVPADADVPPADRTDVVGERGEIIDDRSDMADDHGEIVDRGEMADDHGEILDRGDLSDEHHDRGDMLDEHGDRGDLSDAAVGGTAADLDARGHDQIHDDETSTDRPDDTAAGADLRTDDARGDLATDRMPPDPGVPPEAAGLPPEPVAGDADLAPDEDAGVAAVQPHDADRDEMADDAAIAASGVAVDASDRGTSAVEPLPAGGYTEPEVVGEDAGTVYAGSAYTGDGDQAAPSSTVDGGMLPGAAPADPLSPVWRDSEVEGYRSRWRDLQLRFVDDPDGAAADAGGLLNEVIDGMTAALAARREELDGWRSAEGVDTEQKRVAFTRYREFFEHVLEL